MIYRFKLLLLTGAALSLSKGAFAADLSQPSAEPVVVQSPWDAYVAAGAGFTWLDSDVFPDLDLDDFNAEIRSSAAYQFSNGFGIQSDVVFNYQAIDFDSSDDFNSKNVDVAGHAFYRNSDSFLIGVFGQYGFTSLDPFSIDIDRFYAGGEAQVYWGDFTLYGQGGFQSQDYGIAFGDTDIDGFFVSGEGRYFATDNLKLSLRGGFDTLNFADNFDVDTFTIGGGVEYRFDNIPVSTFLNVDYSKSEVADWDRESSNVRVLAGLKLNLGASTLIERDRAGASLDPFKPSATGSLFFLD